MADATSSRPGPAGVVFLCAMAWAIPGAAHVWLRQRFKGLVFMTVLPLMFAIGIALQGRLFPLDPTEPLVALACLAELSIGLPYFVAEGLGFGAGQVTAVSFEYANAFLIAAGLLNLLVILDARDVALGRKPVGAPEPSR